MTFLRKWANAAGSFFLACSLLLQPSLDSAARNVRGTENVGLGLPAAVRAAGYTTRTFGPALVLGSNFKDFNFNGVTPITGQSVQNADGTVTLPITDGSNYGAGIATAHSTGGSGWTGTAFGGGYYAEAVFKITPTLGSSSLPFPGFWSLNLDHLIGADLQWSGQAAGYIHRMELDVFQWPHNSTSFWEGPIIYDWYGPAFLNSIQNLHGVTITGSNPATFTCTNPTPFSLVVGAYVTISGTFSSGSITGYSSPTTYKISATNGSTTFTLTTVGGAALTTTNSTGAITGIGTQINVLGQPTPEVGAEMAIAPSSLGVYNKYGILVIPATATTQGSITTFLNGVQIGYLAGGTIQPWNQYASGNAPPPAIGSSAASLLDNVNMVFIFGTDVTSPMTIQSFSVYQRSGAQNLVQ